MKLISTPCSKGMFLICIFLNTLFIFSCSSSHSGNKGNNELDTAALLQAGRTRDSLAAMNAIKTWWTASMRNHDKRIAWWRQARFGCFIHWGVYSGSGGVWEGKPVHGYAEHLMRIEKIPLSVYTKEVVEKFDPVDFNADRWVRKIKAAGMKYLIITAKHHDGFAMYHSEVSDYNVVKATPWHHDPMKDLAAACKKYGIKFGFYYSQAFDWQDPNAPGNDWDYHNPGGDKHLFGGVHWYDLHPDMLKRIEKYVNGKAIPQIQELVEKYHPDILWFDTPSKLPFSENLRILEAIRKIDTNVVVNGRLANWGEYHFGDYQNTSDRPAEFYPVKGDWEAIPTTNESYGYSKLDTFHKPASFFIRLLAMAASRGGNVLMNIGPMGNGEIDPRDTAILYHIGQWMKVNGESIYGTKATPLPLQPWGVSTSKNNLIYLQVFHWPADGKLIVGGLQSNVVNASLLSDADHHSFPIKRLNANDIIINVPRKAPDTTNTVIVLQCDNPLMIESVRLLSPAISNRLLAFDSELHGQGLRYGDGKSNRYYVYNWNKPDQWMSWDFRLDKPVKYRMEIKYETDDKNKGSFYQIKAAGKQIVKTVQFPEKKSRIYTEDVGVFTFPEGKQEMTIKPVQINGDEVMKLFEIDLIPQ